MAWNTDPRRGVATAPLVVGAAISALLLGLDATSWLRTGIWRSLSVGAALEQLSLADDPAGTVGMLHAVYTAPLWLVVLGAGIVISGILRLVG